MAPNYNRIVHYIPPEKPFPDLSKEFIEPSSEDYFIYWLFKYKCIVCKHPATEINEIRPRGRSKKNLLDWRNRVTICQKCHTGDNGFHHRGVSKQKVTEMQQLRKEYLMLMGREDYV